MFKEEIEVSVKIIVEAINTCKLFFQLFSYFPFRFEMKSWTTSLIVLCCAEWLVRRVIVITVWQSQVENSLFYLGDQDLVHLTYRYYYYINIVTVITALGQLHLEIAFLWILKIFMIEPLCFQNVDCYFEVIMHGAIMQAFFNTLPAFVSSLATWV